MRPVSDFRALFCDLEEKSLHEKCPDMEFCLVRMRETTDQKNLRIWTLFTQ